MKLLSGVCIHCLGVLALVLLHSQGVRGQIDVMPWASPEPLFNQCCAAYPTPVVDFWGQLHLFWADAEGYIWYTKLANDVWTPPVEVLANPGREAAAGLDAAIDGEGVVHLLWRDGHAGGNVYYAAAPVQGAGDARGWRTPIALTSNALGAALAVAPDGSLFVAYTPFAAGQSFELLSSRNGVEWSPSILAPSQLGGNFTGGSYVSMVIDQTGVIHVAWNSQQYPRGYPEHAIFYQHSSDGGMTWSDPYDPDPLPPEVDVNLDSSFKNKMLKVALDALGDIHLTWHEYTGQRLHRVSHDGGITWGEQEVLFPDLGAAFNGPVDMAFDGDGNMHVVAARGGIWYRMRRYDGQWTQPELVDARPADWHHQRLAVVGGNQVYLFYPDINDTGILWSTHRTVAAAVIRPLPSPTPSSTFVASRVSPTIGAPTLTAMMPSPTATGAPTSWREAPNPSRAAIAWIWVLSPLFLVAGAVITVVLRRRW